MCVAGTYTIIRMCNQVDMMRMLLFGMWSHLYSRGGVAVEFHIAASWPANYLYEKSELICVSNASRRTIIQVECEREDGGGKGREPNRHPTSRFASLLKMFPRICRCIYGWHCTASMFPDASKFTMCRTNCKSCAPNLLNNRRNHVTGKKENNSKTENGCDTRTWMQEFVYHFGHTVASVRAGECERRNWAHKFETCYYVRPCVYDMLANVALRALFRVCTCLLRTNTRGTGYIVHTYAST